MSLFSRHKFVSSPRPNRSRYQKFVRNLASSMSWLHADRVWRRLDELSRMSTSNSTACIFEQPIIANFLLGGANNLECRSCSARWDLYVYLVSYCYMQACLKYGPSFQTLFKGALLSPPATPGYELHPGPDDRGLWPVFKVSRVFEHVKGPKSPWNLEKQRLNGIDKSPLPHTHTDTQRERENSPENPHSNQNIWLPGGLRLWL